jgi:hypothetical protein
MDPSTSTSLLNYVDDLILLLNKDYQVVVANKATLDFFEGNKSIVGKDLDTTIFHAKAFGCGGNIRLMQSLNDFLFL